MPAGSSQQRWPGWLSAISNLLLAAFLGTNLILLSDLTRAYKLVDDVKADSRLRASEKAPDYRVRLFDNTQVQLGTSRGRPLLLYIFSPSCHFCARNLPAINALAGKVKDRIDIVGFSVTTEGLISNRLLFPVIRDFDPSILVAYRLIGTPETNRSDRNL
jgi:hypothetical protein